MIHQPLVFWNKNQRTSAGAGIYSEFKLYNPLISTLDVLNGLVRTKVYDLNVSNFEGFLPIVRGTEGKYKPVFE